MGTPFCKARMTAETGATELVKGSPTVKVTDRARQEMQPGCAFGGA